MLQSYNIFPTYREIINFIDIQTLIQNILYVVFSIQHFTEATGSNPWSGNETNVSACTTPPQSRGLFLNFKYDQVEQQWLDHKNARGKHFWHKSVALIRFHSKLMNGQECETKKKTFFSHQQKMEKKNHRNFKNASSGGFCWEGKKCQLFFIIVKLNPMELTW